MLCAATVTSFTANMGELYTGNAHTTARKSDKIHNPVC